MKISHANLTRTVIYGTEARKIEAPTDSATHTWRVFLRGYKNTDVSYFIRSVTFKTHETFTNPTRTVDTPPFEIEEKGWGEFTIQGKIYFVDVHEKPTTFLVNLKLHNDPNNKVIGDMEYGQEEIVNERLDTIVFESPTEAMYKIIKSHKEPEIEGEVLEKVEEERKKIESAVDFIIERLEKDSNSS